MCSLILNIIIWLGILICLIYLIYLVCKICNENFKDSGEDDNKINWDEWGRGADLGNNLSVYFGIYLEKSLNRKPFEIINKYDNSIIIHELPSHMKLLSGHELGELDIDMEKLYESNKTAALWENGGYNLWRVLQPTVRKCLKDVIAGISWHIPVYDCVIHFRCSDVPFCRHESYHLIKYSWYREAIIVALEHYQIENIQILSCVSHNVNDYNYLCKDLAYDLGKFILDEFGIPFQISCGTIEEDMGMMYKSKVLITGISSFSFFAGLASNNLFIIPTMDKEDDIQPLLPPEKSCRDNMIVIKKAFIRHRDIDDYSNFDSLVAQLRN